PAVPRRFVKADSGTRHRPAILPAIPCTNRPVRPPWFGHLDQLARYGKFFQPEDAADARTQAEVGDGEDIEPPEDENQKHLHRPGADPSNGEQTLGDLLVGEFVNAMESFGLGPEVLRERSDREELSLRETTAPQPFFLGAQDCCGVQPRLAAKRGE